MSCASNEKVPEKIDAAAIRLGEELFTGRNHTEAIMNMEESIPDWKTSNIRLEDGFVTNTGRYVKRDEAGQIAKRAGQLSELRPDLQREAEDYLDANWVNELKPDHLKKF